MRKLNGNEDLRHADWVDWCDQNYAPEPRFDWANATTMGLMVGFGFLAASGNAVVTALALIVACYAILLSSRA